MKNSKKTIRRRNLLIKSDHVWMVILFFAMSLQLVDGFWLGNILACLIGISGGMAIKWIRTNNKDSKRNKMTMHIYYDNKCKKCEALYIPFDDVKCPKCGELEEQRADGVPGRIAMSANLNKSVGRSYVPDAWFVGSFGDHVASFIFRLLDGHEKTDTDFTKYVRETLAKFNWGDQSYSEYHIGDVAIKVKELLYAEVPRDKSMMEKLRSWFI